MVFTFFIILLSITLISLTVIKEKYNPITLFVGFWAIIFELALSNRFGIDRASDRAYSIIFLGVVSYALGCLLVHFFDRKRNRIINPNNTIYFNQRLDEKHIKRIKRFSITITLIMSMYAVRSISFILAGMDLTSLRANFNEIVILNTVERLLWVLFIVPSSFAIMSVDLYLYFVHRKKSFLYYSLFNTILLSICNGGRIILLYFLLQSLFFALIVNAKKTRNTLKKIKPYIQLFFIGAIILFVMYIISEGRQMAASYAESVNVYFSGCFPFFDYQIGLLDSSNVRMHGISFFFGPITIIEMILSHLFGLDYSSGLLAARNIIYSLQDSIDIGTTSRFNAFATVFFYFYMDWGVLGVCIESALYGMLCFYVFNKVRYEKNPRFCMLYALIINSIFSSMVRWQLADVSFTLAILFILILSIGYRKMRL